MRLNLELLPQSEQIRLNQIMIWLRSHPLVKIEADIQNFDVLVSGSYPRLLLEYCLLKNKSNVSEEQLARLEKRLQETDIDIRFYIAFNDNTKAHVYLMRLYEWWEICPPTCLGAYRPMSNFSPDNPYITLESEKLDITVHPMEKQVKPMGNLYFGMSFEPTKWAMNFIFPPGGSEIKHNKITSTPRLWEVIPQNNGVITVNEFLLILHLIKTIGKALMDNWKLGKKDEEALVACFETGLQVSIKSGNEFDHLKKMLNLSIEADKPFDFTSILKEVFAAKYKMLLTIPIWWRVNFLEEIEPKIVPQNQDEMGSIHTPTRSERSDSSDDWSDNDESENEKTIHASHKKSREKNKKNLKEKAAKKTEIKIRKSKIIKLSADELLERRKKRSEFLKKHTHIKNPVKKHENKLSIAIKHPKKFTRQDDCFNFNDLALWADASVFTYSAYLLSYMASGFISSPAPRDRFNNLDKAINEIDKKLTGNGYLSNNDRSLVKDYIEDLLLDFPLLDDESIHFYGLEYIKNWLGKNFKHQDSQYREFIKEFVEQYLNDELNDRKFFNKLKILRDPDTTGKLLGYLEKQERTKLIPTNVIKYGQWLAAADDLRSMGQREQSLGPIFTKTLDTAWKFFKSEPRFRLKYYNLFLNRVEPKSSYWNFWAKPNHLAHFKSALNTLIGNIKRFGFKNIVLTVSEINKNKSQVGLIEFEKVKYLFLDPLVQVLQTGMQLPEGELQNIQYDGLRCFIEKIRNTQDQELIDVYLEYMNTDNFLNTLDVRIMDFITQAPANTPIVAYN